MKIVYFGKVKDGRIVISNRKLFDKEVQTFEGKEIQVRIEKKKKQRSTKQNRWYWGCALPIIQEGLINLGHSISITETHEFLKANFLKQEIVNKDTGEIFILPKSTTELTTSGFMDYKAEIQQFASEFLGVNVPDPNEQTEIEYSK